MRHPTGRHSHHPKLGSQMRRWPAGRILVPERVRPAAQRCPQQRTLGVKFSRNVFPATTSTRAARNRSARSTVAGHSHRPPARRVLHLWLDHTQMYILTSMSCICPLTSFCAAESGHGKIGVGFPPVVATLLAMQKFHCRSTNYLPFALIKDHTAVPAAIAHARFLQSPAVRR